MARLASLFRYRLGLTAGGWLYLLLTAGVGIKAVAAANNTLFLIFATLLAGLPASVLLLWLQLRGLQLTRRLPAAAYAGEPCAYHLEWRNRRSAVAVPFLEARERAPGNRRRLPFQPLACLAPGAIVRLPVRWEAPRRGWLDLGAVEVRGRFPLTGVRLTRYWPAAERLLVYPRRWVFRSGFSWEAWAGMMSRQQSQHRGTDQEEFAGLRDYRPGDHPRSIQWKSSFRLPAQLVVRKFDHPPGVPVTILFDPHLAADAEARLQEAFEDNLGCALALAERLAAQQGPVTFVCGGPAPRRWSLEARGHGFGELRRFLALLQPSRRPVLAALLQAGQSQGESARILVTLAAEGLPVNGDAAGLVILRPETFRTMLTPAHPTVASRPAEAKTV